MRVPLSASPQLRDYNPLSFLTSLIWNTRGDHQCFSFGPRDNQAISWLVATDPNAQISVISGAWTVSLFRSNLDSEKVRSEAARLQKIEAEHLEILRSREVKARIRIWTMAEFIGNQTEFLQEIVDEIGPRNVRRLSETPKMRDLTGFTQFLQDLKNRGMSPYLVGDFPTDSNSVNAPPENKRPYLVK